MGIMPGTLCNTYHQVQQFRTLLHMVMICSGRNWPDCVTIQNEVSIVDMNVKNVYKEEWYDSVSVNEIDSASVVKEMIDVRDGSVTCEIFNIDDVKFIINNLCIN